MIAMLPLNVFPDFFGQVQQQQVHYHFPTNFRIGSGIGCKMILDQFVIAVKMEMSSE
jgi:hypothetical protein